MTPQELFSIFRVYAEVKDGDQFLLGVLDPSSGALSPAKVTAALVKAYLRGDIALSDVHGTLDGQTATLEAIIADIRSRLTSTVDKSTFNTLSALFAEMSEHSGMISFDGFVEGVDVARIGVSSDSVQGYYYDRAAKTFVALTNKTYEVVGGGETSYVNYTDRMKDYAKDEDTLWPLRVYHCKADGRKYMWDGDTLAPLDETAIAEQTATETAIMPGILNRWGAVESLSLTRAISAPEETGPTILFPDRPYIPAGVQEYRLEFTVSGDSFTLWWDGTLRWPDGEAPEWQDGWTYQVSIEGGLAVAAGWPAEEEE